MSCYAKFFEFYPGEHRKLQIQINVLNKASDCKEPMDLNGYTGISVELPASPDNIVLNTTTTPSVVVDNAALGKISIELTPTEIDTMVDGSIIVKVTNATSKVTVAVAAAAVRKLTVPNC